MKKLIKLGLCLIIIIVFTSGCWGSKEIDEAAYVLALGLDQGPGKNIMVSVAIGNVTTAASSSSGGQPLAGVKTRVFSTVAPNIFSGLNIINTILERQISLSHLKLVVFSEGLARQDLGNHLDTFVRWRQFRRTVYMAVAKGEARSVVEAIVPPNEDNPGKFLEMILLTQGYIGYTPRGQILGFYNAYKTKGEAPIALLVAPRMTKYQLSQDHPENVGSGINMNTDIKNPGTYIAGQPPLQGEGLLEFQGTAIFNKGRMVGELNGNETIALSMLRGEFNRAYITVPDLEVKDKLIQVELSRTRNPKIHVKKSGAGIFKTQVKIFLNADVVSVQSGKSYELPNRIKIIERAAKKWVIKQCQSAIRKAQSNGTDIFGFGRSARWLAPDQQAWDQWNWRRTFTNMPVDLQVKVHLNHTGLVIEKNAVGEE